MLNWRYLRNVTIRLYCWYQALGRYDYEQDGEIGMIENMERCIFVQVVERPARKVLLRRGKKAEEYFAYCEEVGCDVWCVLSSIREALHEPVGMWLPPSMVKPGTSRYVQGVEVPSGYANVVPEGYELIDLAPCKLMVFQGVPYDDEEFAEEIGYVQKAMARFDPELHGYRWADDNGPRIQLEPKGYRGYIEARPVEHL